MNIRYILNKFLDWWFRNMSFWGPEPKEQKKYGMGWIPDEPMNDPFEVEQGGILEKVKINGVDYYRKYAPLHLSAPNKDYIKTVSPEHDRRYENSARLPDIGPGQTLTLKILTPTEIQTLKRSIVTPVLMSQYLENIKHLESAIGAEYWEDIDYQQYMLCQLTHKITNKIS